MKKLFIDKNEGVAEIVERIISDDGTDLTLVIPKDSRLKESVSNFNLIKREADSSGKNILVESVDEEVLALAKTSRIDAMHPFFDEERKSSPFSDIVPRGADKEGATASIPVGSAVSRGEAEDVKAKSRKVKDEQPPAVLFRKAKDSGGAVAGVEAVGVSGSVATREVPYTAKKRRRVNFKSALFVAVPLLVLVLVFFVISNFFSKADITISFTKIPWSYEHAFSVDKSVSEIDFGNNVLPGEVFSNSKDTVQLYPASSKQTVSQKASGVMTIYNAYSSERQTLVATTRFVTPDGNIFRLANAVVVPGAQIKNGNIMPSSIDAQVVAATSGTQYNLGPVSRLTIPGFKGTPRYDGFYGELKQGTSGGFVGEKAVPTADDITKAKAKATDALRNVLENSLTSAYPTDCKVLDGAEQFNVTDLKVNENTNASGSFSVIGRANILVLCFRESGEKSLRLFLTAAAVKNSPNMVFDNLQINYGQVKADLKNGKETFNVTAAGTLKPDFSADDFKSKILGQKVDNARLMIAALPDLAAAKISLWPLWLWWVPSNPAHVKITVN